MTWRAPRRTQDSSRLAYAIHQQLIAATGAHDRGVQQAPFFVLTGVEAPAVLVEVGYISHPEEGRGWPAPSTRSSSPPPSPRACRAFLAEVRRRDRRSGREVAAPAEP